jgi:hypothetical protein
MGVETLPLQRKVSAWQIRLWHHTAYNNFDVPRLAQEKIKHRQRLSAEATNEARKAATEAKIKQAIEQLRAANQKVTRAAVAKMTGLSRTQKSVKYGGYQIVARLQFLFCVFYV